jgi:multicomponent Na+:H+ antiporter subunit F
MTILATVCLVIVALCMLPCVYRVAAGPHALDRLLALDLIGVLLAVAIAVYAIVSDTWIYLEISMGLAVLAFVGTIAVAQYIEHEGLV